NAEPWIAEYRELTKDIVFVAEDLFGDQYGFSFRDDAPHPVKFWCEGGAIENLSYDSLEDWLLRTVLVSEPSAFDWRLSSTVAQQYLKPTVTEHLSFTLPLIAGGEYTFDNLEVLDSRFHLNILGQLSVKNLSLPEGIQITRFWSES